VSDVCIPTLETSCQTEKGGINLGLFARDNCYDVVRTFCTERHQVLNNEVCAFSYKLRAVPTEAKMVVAHWEHRCNDESFEVCVQKGHYAEPVCHEEVRQTCLQEPSLESVIKPVTVQLPSPVEVCIKKQVVIPHIECDTERVKYCMPEAYTEKVEEFHIDKCSVSLGGAACQDIVLPLPSQVCVPRIENVFASYV